MTDEIANLVLELLRGMRGEMTTFRADMEKRLTAIEERLDSIDTQLEGLRYIFVASVGSLVTDLKSRGTRIATLEGVHP